MQSILKWWLIFCLTLLGFGTAIYFDVHKILYEADVTRLSYLIISIFICTSVWIGIKTYRVGKLEDYDQKSEVGWFIAESCLALGMIGTVTGFLLMLGISFSNLDITNQAALQDALINMAIGMSTALYTTLIGLISSLIIKIQLVNLETLLED